MASARRSPAGSERRAAASARGNGKSDRVGPGPSQSDCPGKINGPSPSQSDCPKSEDPELVWSESDHPPPGPPPEGWEKSTGTASYASSGLAKGADHRTQSFRHSGIFFNLGMNQTTAGACACLSGVQKRRPRRCCPNWRKRLQWFGSSLSLTFWR